MKRDKEKAPHRWTRPEEAQREIYKFRIAEKGRKGKCSVTALTIMRFHYPEV